MKNPNLIPAPFAQNGHRDEIPAIYKSDLPSQKATWDTGFPQITMMPVTAGGLPPSGRDFNGVFNQISDNIVHLSKGGKYKFSQEYANSINGYPKGAILQDDTEAKEYQSLIDNNKINFNTESADKINSAWKLVNTNQLLDELNKKLNRSDVVQSIGSSQSTVMSQKAATDALNEKQPKGDYATNSALNAVNDNANTRLEKNRNGADIPNKPEFVKNLGLLGTVDLANNAVPNSRKINNKPLTGDITLLAGDVYAYPSPAYSDGLPDDNYIGPFLGGPSVGWAKGVSIGVRGGDTGQIWIDSGAALHTRFLNKGNGATQQRIVSIPIGATIEWQSEAAIPFGFMENNGREFNKSQYPELLKVFPSGRLPDDRGLFKRGLDTMGGISRGLDPGRKLGTVQNDAIRNITGGFGSPTTEEGNFGDGAFSVKVGYGGRKAGAGGNYVSYRFDASRVVPTANENRPVNKSVIYITRVF